MKPIIITPQGRLVLTKDGEAARREILRVRRVTGSTVTLGAPLPPVISPEVAAWDMARSAAE